MIIQSSSYLVGAGIGTEIALLLSFRIALDEVYKTSCFKIPMGDPNILYFLQAYEIVDKVIVSVKVIRVPMH